MRFPRLHAWPRDSKAAVALQRELADRIQLIPAPRRPRIFAGCDAAFSRDEKHVIAGVVVFECATTQVIEQVVATAPIRFPYVPGLLSFRELPALLKAFRKLRTTPDVVLADAQGIAHPRRFGLAAHLGLWLGIPTVGCAKSRLCGESREPAASRGSATKLLHKGEQIGWTLRTRDRVNPLFVSPGNLVDMNDAKRLTLMATTRYRLPEPTRLAHQLVTKARNGAAR